MQLKSDREVAHRGQVGQFELVQERSHARPAQESAGDNRDKREQKLRADGVTDSSNSKKRM
jgi:hypothetical protein